AETVYQFRQARDTVAQPRMVRVWRACEPGECALVWRASGFGRRECRGVVLPRDAQGPRLSREPLERGPRAAGRDGALGRWMADDHPECARRARDGVGAGGGVFLDDDKSC